VVDIFSPEIILFTETPHHATQYILYAVCHKRGVKTIMFKPVYTNTLRILIYNDIDEDPFETLEGNSLSLLDSDDTMIIEYVNRLRGQYLMAIPNYMQKVVKSPNHFSAYLKTLSKNLLSNKFINLFSKKGSSNVLKLKSKPIEDSFPNRFQLYWFKFKGSLKKKSLRRMYRDLAVRNPNLDTKFVLVALQYQPERTSSPDGGAFVDQFLMINLLRKCLPPDVNIFIKEHAAQFHPKMDGHLSRFKFNYSDIKSLNNTHLIAETYPVFELIDKCWFVATITGTIGLEAIARGKPVLIFGGGCWYRSLQGVFYTPTIEKVRAAIKEIETIELNKNEIVNFLKRFNEITFSAKLTPNYPVAISQEENVLALSNAVEKYLKFVN